MRIDQEDVAQRNDSPATRARLGTTASESHPASASRSPWRSAGLRTDTAAGAGKQTQADTAAAAAQAPP
jgi:hypothetical protein